MPEINEAYDRLVEWVTKGDAYIDEARDEVQNAREILDAVNVDNLDEGAREAFTKFGAFIDKQDERLAVLDEAGDKAKAALARLDPDELRAKAQAFITRLREIFGGDEERRAERRRKREERRASRNR